MDSLNRDFMAGLFDNPEPPCLSIYQPTHRHHPDNQQDSIRFRNLVKALEQSIRREYSAGDAGRLLEPFHKLAADSVFWSGPRLAAHRYGKEIAERLNQNHRMSRRRAVLEISQNRAAQDRADRRFRD